MQIPLKNNCLFYLNMIPTRAGKRQFHKKMLHHFQPEVGREKTIKTPPLASKAVE
jgi:hypothetical protein